MVKYSLRAAAYPVLDSAQMSAVATTTRASPKSYEPGQALFRAGSRKINFFVICAGEVEIRDESGEEPVTITVHGPGEFAGDVSHITGHPSIVSAIARTSVQAYEISSDALQRLLLQSPALSDVILQAFIARRQLLQNLGTFTGVRVIGSRYSKDTHRIRDFLSKNHVLFTWLDLEYNLQVDQLLRRFGLNERDTPVVAWGQKLLLRNPTNEKLALELGLRQAVDNIVYDLAIVGAGPAGLAAAVYGASEGLTTVTVEHTAAGGQANGSMRIENYLGFPTGISGQELTDRAVLQARKFGALITIGSPAIELAFDNGYTNIQIEGSDALSAKCLIIATGADYRRLTAEGCDRFEGSGVYYVATPNEAELCRGTEVVIVGGGNSAGQAAIYLSGHASKVYLVIRGSSLYRSMSAYLVQRIEETENIAVLGNTEVSRMFGNEQLAWIELIDRKSGYTRTIDTAALFSFIGAAPRTDWLPPEIETNPSGYILTGNTVTRPLPAFEHRRPFLLETSRPGVFAAGDVRADSIKRIASAVGEGAMAVRFVHEYLQDR